MAIRKDIWRPAIVPLPMAELIARGDLEGLPVRWLPASPSFSFLADPFGFWHDGALHVLAETYDYRVRVGAIDVLTFDRDLNLLRRCLALREPWHLSYPTIVQEDGETYMLPEAHRSGKLTLYRMVEPPHRWEPAAIIALDRVPVDASPIFHAGLWWLFYTPAGSRAEKVEALHVAFAERLRGPWRPHARNPVRRDRASARPGGTPIVVDGAVVVPMQDCTGTYGGAIRPLRIGHLTPDRFEAEAGEPIIPPPSFAPFTGGLHTMAAAGDVTLIDAKRFERAVPGLLLGLGRRLRRFGG